MSIQRRRKMINKGDRVLSKDGKKSGTAIRDEHASLNGPAVYVHWDNAKRPACPVFCKNLRPFTPGLFGEYADGYGPTEKV
jgi:hypothetical protein